MGHYFGAVFLGEYSSEGTLSVNPWIDTGCGEATGDCRPPSLLGDLWPECGDCRPPSAFQTTPEPEPELAPVGHARVPAGAVFGAL